MNNINIICPSCGQSFTKNKYRARKNPYCRKCSTRITYSNNPEKLKNALTKRKETCIEKYGVENVAQDKEIKDKYVSTQIKKYGGMGGFSYDNEKIQVAAHSDEANEKRKNTCLEHFGETHQMKNKKILEKVQNNTMSNYGSIGPVARYKFLDIYFDSSWELAYYIWLLDNKKDFIYHPNTYINYIGEDGLEHKYYPDFLIEGKFFEIKGNQFFNNKNEPYNNYKKEFWWNKYNAMINNGVVILREDNIKDALHYVNATYGNNLLKNCKIKKV